jgi:hypothetical protein
VLPKSERNRHWIDIGFVPPRALVALTVELAMMDAAQRHRELIRHFVPKRSRLCEPKVMDLAGLPATNDTRLNSNEAKMILNPDCRPSLAQALRQASDDVIEAEYQDTKQTQPGRKSAA